MVYQISIYFKFFLSTLRGLNFAGLKFRGFRLKSAKYAKLNPNQKLLSAKFNPREKFRKMTHTRKFYEIEAKNLKRDLKYIFDVFGLFNSTKKYCNFVLYYFFFIKISQLKYIIFFTPGFVYSPAVAAAFHLIILS